jgi:hypothetical protein
MREAAWLADLFRCLCVDVQDVQRVLKLVCDFHAPFPARRQLAVYVSQHLASRDCSFPPRGMFVWQFLALIIELGSVVVGVEKIPGHQLTLTSAAAIRANWPNR